LFLIGAEYVLNRAVFPARLVTVYGFLFAFLLTLLFRTIARGIRRFLFTQNIGIANVLIVGTTDITAELAQQLANPKLGYKVVGIIGDRRGSYPNIDSSIQFKNFEEASKYLKKTDINTIVQTELFVDQTQNDEILAYAQEHHIAYRFVPGNSNLFVGSIEVNLFEGIPTVAVHQTALTGWGRILKRIFDLIFGIFMVIIASPILLSVWLLLATVGGGKPIYKQTRMSRFNTKIGLYKFRTHSHVYNGLTPEEGFAKMGKPELAKKYRENGDYIENDPRISIIGRFLRNTSIDELPQLFNVIKGDLSLVGPRPLIPQEINMAENKHVILSVKPGVTGLAVISGRKNIPFEERRKLDMYYAQNWSFWMDLVIIAKTAVQVVARAFSGKAD
jgi:exopolysaccharide biosynthesis polyprenyl glycosylphosphotransferase